MMPESVAHCQTLGIDDARVHDLQEPWPIANGPARVLVLPTDFSLVGIVKRL
jgi:hypothetical protein